MPALPVGRFRPQQPFERRETLGGTAHRLHRGRARRRCGDGPLDGCGRVGTKSILRIEFRSMSGPSATADRRVHAISDAVHRARAPSARWRQRAHRHRTRRRPSSAPVRRLELRRAREHPPAIHALYVMLGRIERNRFARRCGGRDVRDNRDGKGQRRSARMRRASQRLHELHQRLALLPRHLQHLLAARLALRRRARGWPRARRRRGRRAAGAGGR